MYLACTLPATWGSVSGAIPRAKREALSEGCSARSIARAPSDPGRAAHGHNTRLFFLLIIFVVVVPFFSWGVGEFASAPKGPRALRSLLQRESSLFPSPQPPPPTKICPARPPPSSSMGHFCRKCADNWIGHVRLGSGPAQPATRLQPQAQRPSPTSSRPDVPQPLSPAAQAGQALTSCSRLGPSHPAGPALRRSPDWSQSMPAGD